MPAVYDVAIIGLGAMGSAAAYHCARRGWKVLGLDQFTPPHSHGSSHGQTRIIREAYFEHPIYVPLVQRAYELWNELESLTGAKLFQKTGGLMIGAPEGTIVSGALLSARTHGLEHQILSTEELRQRFPALSPTPGTVAVWEPRAGILFPEQCVAAHLQLAREHGADLVCKEAVLQWEPHSDSIRIVTARTEYNARKVLFCAGSWLSSLVPNLSVPLTLERQILYWFRTGQPELFEPRTLPVFIWEHSPEKFFYGFPDLGNGVKVAQHGGGIPTTHDTLQREVAQEEIRLMQSLLKPFLPGLTDPVHAETCIYTNTPNSHFLLDFHPGSNRILLASPCSGHGFKFSSALGEAMADLLDRGQSKLDLSLFRLAAFASAT
ncbi:MAG: dependent oxidoreductase [Verrucomicrobiales bacterium]|nr:dependent oxidoreductase [Verrucomicrobiales bacterium]